jgi:hypothetical protein
MTKYIEALGPAIPWGTHSGVQRLNCGGEYHGERAAGNIGIRAYSISIRNCWIGLAKYPGQDGSFRVRSKIWRDIG